LIATGSFTFTDRALFSPSPADSGSAKILPGTAPTITALLNLFAVLEDPDGATKMAADLAHSTAPETRRLLGAAV